MLPCVWNADSQHFAVNIKASKTADPFRQGVSVNIHRTGGRYCPVEAIHTYLLARRSQRFGFDPAAPFFLLPDNQALSRRFFIEKVKSSLQRLGHNPSLYNGHSFSIGAATSAAKAQVSDHLIRVLGRWSSDCYIRYIRVPQDQVQKAHRAMGQLGKKM